MSSRGKRLGDYAAGTYVVRDRVRLRLAPPTLMPPPLAAWARPADMAALPTGLALAVRQFLGRLPTLDPQSRRHDRHPAGRPGQPVRRTRAAARHAAGGLPRRGDRLASRARPGPAAPRGRAAPAADRAPVTRDRALPGDVLVHLRRARDHADRHYTEPLDLEALADVAGMSKYHFQRLFTATYGLSPAAHLSAAPGRAGPGPAPRHQPHRHRGLPRRRLLEPRLVQQPVPRARRRVAERVPAAVRRRRRAADPRLLRLHVGARRDGPQARRSPGPGGVLASSHDHQHRHRVASS